MIKRITITAITLLAILALIGPVSYAVPTLWLEDPLFPPIIIPGDPSGAVSYFGPVGTGTWQVNLTTGITKPAIGNPAQAIMDLNSLNITSTGPGTLIIKFYEDNFGPSNGNFKKTIGGTVGGGPGSYLIYNAYKDGIPINGLGPFTEGAFNGTEITGVGPIPLPYSLTQEIIIVHTSNGMTTFDAGLRSVPEPLTLILLCIGFLGLGLLKKKEDQK